MSIVDTNIETIKCLCQKHKVAKLFVFGSVLTQQFNKDSDVDFVVDFTRGDLYNYADNYFNLKQSLENLLRRKVDLLEENAIKNPFLKKSIDESKQIVYG